MYHGPTFHSPGEIREYLNGEYMYANFDEFKKFEYPRYGNLELRACKVDDIKMKYFFDGTIVNHSYTGKILFHSSWANVKDLRFDDRLFSTSDDFDWKVIQRRINRPVFNHPNGLNILLCLDNSYPIPLELSQFSKINSINGLDFGKYPMLKDYLLEQNSNSHPMSFYLRDPNLPIMGIIRTIENKKFPRFQNGEFDYDDSWVSQHLIEFAKMKPSSLFYREFIHYLDFDGEENLEIWSRILFSLYNEKELHTELFGSRPPYISKGTDNIHIGLHFGNIRIPGPFLDKLRKHIIPLYEENLEEENRRRLAEEELKKRKEEEEYKKRDFNITNKHSRDANISLCDSHYYFHSARLLGTKKIVYNFFPKFDADYWAGIKAPLEGKTKEELLEEWELKGFESVEAGTKLHQYIDDYYHHKEIKTEDKDFSLFKRFEDAYTLNPYRSEWAIYDEEIKIAGVVDMLDYSNGEYILYDWKRSDKIVEGGQPIKENKFGEFGLRPIDNVPNTDYWHYALQLSFYRYILEKNYGIRVKESRLVVLHPSLKLPVVLTVPYMIDEVNKIIEVMKI